MLKILSICAALSFLFVSGAMAQIGSRCLQGGYQKSLRRHQIGRPPRCHLPQGACRRPFRRV